MEHLIGTELGGCKLEEIIGEGRMSVVFKAYQRPPLDRHVAVKVLRPFLATRDSNYIKRFEREAASSAKLEHPHILPVHNFGVEQNYSYIVMRYVKDSQTLRHIIGQQPLSEKRAIYFITQVAKALGYAHEQGVLHRDVKPSNVLIMDGDWAQLSDFGLAKIRGSSTITEPGTPIGSARYMSPEQFRGKGISRHSDIYALCIILYEMLTGEIPHDANEDLTIGINRLLHPPRSPRDINPSITEIMEQVILRGLEMEPDHRYDSISDFIGALELAVVDESRREPSQKDRETVPSVHPSIGRFDLLKKRFRQSVNISQTVLRKGLSQTLSIFKASLKGLFYLFNLVQVNFGQGLKYAIDALKRLLSHPTWVGIGAIATIIAVIIALWPIYNSSSANQTHSEIESPIANATKTPTNDINALRPTYTPTSTSTQPPTNTPSPSPTLTLPNVTPSVSATTATPTNTPTTTKTATSTPAPTKTSTSTSTATSVPPTPTSTSTLTPTSSTSSDTSTNSPFIPPAVSTPEMVKAEHIGNGDFNFSWRWDIDRALVNERWGYDFRFYKGDNVLATHLISSSQASFGNGVWSYILVNSENPDWDWAACPLRWVVVPASLGEDGEYNGVLFSEDTILSIRGSFCPPNCDCGGSSDNGTGNSGGGGGAIIIP